MNQNSSEWFAARTSPAKVLNDTPRDFGRTDAIPSEKYLENLVNAGFLFARKFGHDENGELTKDYSMELPKLWQKFEQRMGTVTDERLARESMLWPVLDVGNVVAKNSAQDRVPSEHRRRRQGLFR